MKCGTKKMAMGGGVEHKGKTKGKMVKMAMGGMPLQAAGRMPPQAMQGMPPEMARTTPMMMKKGGSVSKRADGIAKKGKTNCKVC
jgi:hypothetical protein